MRSKIESNKNNFKMKKILLTFLFSALALVGVDAQYAVTNHRFFDNWSIGADGGVNTNLHSWDNVGGVVGLQITKGVTPVLSLEFSSQVGLNDLVWDGDGISWNVLGDKKHVSTINAIGSAKVNLMNWFGGYLGKPRIFEIQARGGLGYQRALNPIGSQKANSFVGKTGLDFDFNMGKARAWTASIRPAVLWNHREYGNKARLATAQVTAGITYHFKTSNGTHNFKRYDVGDMENEIARLNEELAKKPTEVVVEKEVEKIIIKEVRDTIVVKEKVSAQETTEVTFANESAVLTKEAKEALSKIQGQKVAVEGFASPYGTKEYNLQLSQRRADNVAAFLKDNGNEVVSSVGKGVVGNSKRVVIVNVE